MKNLAVLVVCAVGLSAGRADAQFLDLSHLVRQNMQFDLQMEMNAKQFVNQWYQNRQEWRRRTGYYGPLPSPVSPMDVHRSINELNRQYARNNANWHVNSNRQTNAVGRWTTGAIRGQGWYYSPMTGRRHLLPWQPSVYTVGPYGRHAYPGRYQYGNHLYPAYGR